jgi:hypothetical protein
LAPGATPACLAHGSHGSSYENDITVNDTIRRGRAPRAYVTQQYDSNNNNNNRNNNKNSNNPMNEGEGAWTRPSKTHHRGGKSNTPPRAIWWIVIICCVVLFALVSRRLKPLNGSSSSNGIASIARGSSRRTLSRSSSSRAIAV